MIKKLNIDFDQWEELNKDNENIKLFIEDKEDKYALYLNDEQYFDIFVLYLKENNIELYWRSGKNAINFKPSSINSKDMVIYKHSYDNYKLSYSDLDYYFKVKGKWDGFNKIKLLNI
jgi:hypothetical protein